MIFKKILDLFRFLLWISNGFLTTFQQCSDSLDTDESHPVFTFIGHHDYHSHDDDYDSHDDDAECGGDYDDNDSDFMESP